jgi:hypothetical protein
VIEMSMIGRRDVLIGLGLAPFVAAATEFPEGWTLLGTATVRRSSLNSVEITVAPKIRLLSQLKLRVRRSDAVLLSAVRMKDLIVTFGNGERATLPIAADIRLGKATNELDLFGRTRTVRKVRLHYSVLPSRRVLSKRARGVVELWGRR